MEVPLVSIVMPVYNGEKFLAQSIESCLAQTYANWELIIIDDCSTDTTPFIIERFVQADKRILSARNQQNLKLPGTFNAGYRLAKGDYYTWLSSDDNFHPEAFKQAVSFLETNPQIDLVYSHFSLIDENGCVTEKITVAEPEILAVRHKVGPCRFYRRAVHEKLGGYDESLFLVEDYDFLLRAFCLFQMRPLHQELYQFRLHESALTSTHAEQVPMIRDLAKEKNLPLLERKSLQLAAQCHISLIDSALVRKDIKRARRHAWAAFCCAPHYVLRHNLKMLLAAVGGDLRNKIQNES